MVTYVIRTDLWENFYFVQRGQKNVKEIVFAILKTSLEIHPQDKMLLRIKNGIDFRNNSLCLFSTQDGD